MAFSPLKFLQDSFTSPGTGEPPIGVYAFFGLALAFLLAALFPHATYIALTYVADAAPIWLPLLLIPSAIHMWKMYRQAAYISSEKYVLLEIKPPRTHSKTPLAMEAVLSGIHLSPGESTWYARAILGKVRPWWSLEIASLEGQIHFFIWTRESFRRNVESNLYAQYPGVQIVEVPDYTRLISARPSEWGIWGCDYAFTKPDPYPIKTYIDYGLDKPEKEEEQVDLFANLLEFMGTLGPGEQMWLQFIIRVHKGEKYGKKGYTWVNEAAELVQELRAKTVGKVKYRDVFTGEMRETEGFPNPTKGESDTMAAIERNTSKLAFDVGVRSVYIARPGSFHGTAIPGVVGIFKQFSSERLNGFKPAHWMIPFNDYPWEFYIKKRKEEVAKGLIDAFRRRSYFYEPYKTSPLIMSTEELATLYHIPSGSVQTPALVRVQSATTTAPINLPT